MMAYLLSEVLEVIRFELVGLAQYRIEWLL